MIEAEDDSGQDAHFLSLVEAAEAEALVLVKNKRQKISATGSNQKIVDGSYMAALRGSRSSLWQQQQQEIRHQQKKNDSNISLRQGNSFSSNGGACFKCGMPGHWARDCTAIKEGEGGRDRGAVIIGGAEGDVAEKPCPCGSGSCLVLTSNTVKNPGRKFYRCPVKEENGGCNFFEWCNNPSSGLPTSGSASNYHSNSSVSDFPCPCGAGSCLVLITKTGKNVGQQYYRCPATEGRGCCGFFKWCNEPSSVSRQTALKWQSQGTHNYSSGQISGEKNGSSCFKCGQEGHWARDCTKPLSDSYADVEGNPLASSGSGSCFKCGKAGHWARDCTAQDSSADSGDRKASRFFRTPFVNKY